MRILEPKSRASLVDGHLDAGNRLTVTTWTGELLSLDGSGTHFGFLQSGTARLQCDSGAFDLRAGMYFSVPRGGRIEGDGRGLVR